MIQNSQHEKKQQALSSSAQPSRVKEHKAAPRMIPEEYSPADKAGMDPAPEKIKWGREMNLDQIIAWAKSGRIREIQWHVMPNILRVETVKGEIFHLKNENKGVDLRNTLVDAGVRVGKGGVIFRHVF